MRALRNALINNGKPSAKPPIPKNPVAKAPVEAEEEEEEEEEEDYDNDSDNPNNQML